MKILLTGGCGFIGTSLVEKLLDNSHTVLNIDKLTNVSNIERLEYYCKNDSYKHLKVDICDGQVINDAVFEYKPDIIVHMAAESHVDNSIIRPKTFLDTNVNGTFNLCASSLEYYEKYKPDNFKFIHISTDEVFGSIDFPDKFTENSNYAPNSPYSASKASGDSFVRAFKQTYGLPSVILNCCNNYGPYQFPEKLIPLVIRKCINNEEIPLYGDGKHVREWIYVEDYCDAILSIISAAKYDFSYLVGSGVECTNESIVHRICEIMRTKTNSNTDFTKNISFVPDRKGHDRRYSLNSDKFSSHFKWKTQVSFDEGLNKTIDWYLDHINSWEKQ